MSIVYYAELFIDYMNSGGFVMWPLFILVCILWYSLGMRFYLLKRGSKKSVRNLIRKYKSGKRVQAKGLVEKAIYDGLVISKTQKVSCRRSLDDAFYKYEVNLKKYSKLVMTIVAAAPLIGLLGTVVGMIESFDSLASAALFSLCGGIAGGISQALFTTQLGLVVAVPGLVIGRLLQRRADNMEIDLEMIKDIYCSEGIKDEI